MENAFSASIGRTFAVTNRYNGHTWIGDEPLERGGENLGPDPMGLFLSGLASCRLITIQMYAQHKGWEVQSMTISLEITPLADGHAITQELQFEGKLDEKQRERLKVISHRCPVSRLILNKIESRDR